VGNAHPTERWTGSLHGPAYLSHYPIVVGRFGKIGLLNSLLAYLQFTGYFHYRMALTILVVTICSLPWRPRWISWIRNRLCILAEKRALAITLTGILAFVVTSSLAIKRGLPVPYVHDEFSYLLSADTFAHGRLTNPSPEVWEPFESEHILVRPTYQSKYQPGQGIFMALGQVLTGHPIWGVWLSAALAAAAVHWALLGFMSPRWAFLGAILAILHPQLLEWGQRYWGGSAAVLGGALLLGGIGRIVSCRGMGVPPMSPRRTMGVSPMLFSAIGMALLAITRPYEGFILTLLLFIGAALMFRRKSAGLRVLLRKVLLPALAILLPFSLWLCYYNYKVTSHPLRMPYVEHQSQYATVPLFLFQNAPENPPQYRNMELWRFYWRDQRYLYLRRENWRMIRDEALRMIGGLYQACLGNVESLTIALLVVPWGVWRIRRMRMLVVTLILFTVAILLGTFMIGHYAAPAAALVATIILMALRLMQRMGRSVGRLLVRVAVAIAILWSIFWWIAFFNWNPDPREYQMRRLVLQYQVEQNPGKHLLLLRYFDHNPHEEWVYNGADLEGPGIIWAREMDDDINRRLLAHYADRQVWIIEPDVEGKPPTKIREALK
jgi:hypothetical protein